MNEIFIESNLTRIPAYPNRYIIEFRDILIDYFGYIFPEPIIKKEKGLISEVEFKNLQWQMKFVAKRPNVQSAYQFLKDGYPKRVQTYWETIDTGEAADVFDAARSISQG